MGKSLAALCWSLKQPAGQARAGSGVGWSWPCAASVQKGSHWGACSVRLENLALWEEPTTSVLRAAWGKLYLPCPTLINCPNPGESGLLPR